MPDGPCQTASREKHFKIITSCVCHYVQMIVIFKPGNLQRNPVGPSACCLAARAGVGEQYMPPPQQLEISRNIETTLSPSLCLSLTFFLISPTQIPNIVHWILRRRRIAKLQMSFVCLHP
jgi:hypothetical protein